MQKGICFDISPDNTPENTQLWILERKTARIWLFVDFLYKLVGSIEF
jgi:hypothetical protein